MTGWLPEGYGEPEAGRRAEVAVAAVRTRFRREKHEKMALLGLAVVGLAIVGFWSVSNSNENVQPLLVHSARPSPHAVPAPSGSDVALPVTLQKEGENVQVAWTGDPSSEYVVYRCTSPRFDACSTAGVVKGNSWSDPETGQARLVFYKVEPKRNSSS